jgi:hypothetical protein
MDRLVHQRQHAFGNKCLRGLWHLVRPLLYRPQMPLLTGPMMMGDRVWITADVFVALGPSISERAVAARSIVFNHLPPWRVATEHPAKIIRKRTLRHASIAEE